MSKQISNLSIGLDADLGGLARTLGGPAIGILSKFAGGVAGLGSSLGGLAIVGGVIGGALAIVGGALVSAYEAATNVKEQFAAIDRDAKLADRLGISTEALVGFQHAAALAGIDAESLGDGLSKMEKNLGEASIKGGPAADAIARLGLNVDSLAKMNPEDAFKTLADSLAAIPNPAQRAAETTEIFGKAGQNLLPLLSKGAAGIQAAQIEAQKLGLTFSRVDAGKIETANESIIRLKSTFTGVARTIAIALAPLVTWGADKFTGFMTRAIPVIRAAVGEITSIVTSIYTYVAPIFDRIEQVATRGWQMLSPLISSALGTVWATIQGYWATIYSYISDIGQGIYTAVANNWETIVSTVVTAVLGVWDVIQSGWGIIVDLASNVWTSVGTIWESATQAITGTTGDLESETVGNFTGIINAAQSLADYFSFATSVVSYTLSHLGDFVELEATGIALDIVRMGNQISWVFTDVIPAVIVWFQNEWVHIFTDIGSYTATFFTNLSGNIVSVVKNIPGLLSGEVSFGDLWKPLGEGFKSTIEQLPQIADREIGGLEKSLQDQSDALSDAFGKGLADHLTTQGDKAAAASKSVSDAIKKMFTLPDVKSPKIPKVDPLKPKLDPSNLSLSITPEIKRADAVLNGSAEAQALAYAGPSLINALKGKGGTSLSSNITTPTSPTISSPVTSTASGTNDFNSWLKSQMTTDTDYFRRIELNTRTPQYTPSSIS